MGSVSDNLVVNGDASASQLLLSAGHLGWNEGVEEPTAETAYRSVETAYRAVCAEVISSPRRPPAETNNLVANGSGEVLLSSRGPFGLLDPFSLDIFFSDSILDRFLKEEVQDPVIAETNNMMTLLSRSAEVLSPAETNNLMAQIYIYAQALLPSRRPSRWSIASVTGVGTNSFRQRMSEEEDATMQDPVLSTSEVALDVVETPPDEGNGSAEALLASRQPIASVTGVGTVSFLQRISEEEGGTMQDPVLSTSEVALDVVEMPPAEGNGSAEALLASRRPIASVTGVGTDSFRPRMSEEEGGTMQDPVLSTSEVALDVIETPLAEGNGSAEALLASRRSIASVTGVGTDSFRQRMLEEGVVMPDHVPANPVVEPNVSEEVPAETNKETLCGILGKGGMKPSYAFTLVVFGAIGLLEVKAQARFPFKTNPHTSKVICTSLLLCGLAAIADHIISSTHLGPNSVYARAARWGGYVFAFVMAGSLASLLFI